MCCGDPPPAPNLEGNAAASEQIGADAATAGQAQLDWARSSQATNEQNLADLLGMTVPAAQEMFNAASSDRQRYEQVFQPLQDQFIAEAQGYDTQQRRDREAARAIADTGAQFDAQRRNALQRLEGYGVDPSQTRNAALDIGVRTAQAAAQAQAGTNASRYVEQTGRDLRERAINMGQNLPGQAAQQAAIGSNIGTAGQQVANQTYQTGAGLTTSAIPFMQTGLQGQQQGADIRLGQHGAQLNNYEAESAQMANNLQGLGSIAGMAIPVADGGRMPSPQAIPFMADGHVPEMGLGDGSGVDDTVPAQLSEGEFVIPADVVRKKGEEFFEKLIERYHTPAAQQRAA